MYASRPIPFIIAPDLPAILPLPLSFALPRPPTQPLKHFTSTAGTPSTKCLGPSVSIAPTRPASPVYSWDLPAFQTANEFDVTTCHPAAASSSTYVSRLDRHDVRVCHPASSSFTPAPAFDAAVLHPASCGSGYKVIMGTESDVRVTHPAWPGFRPLRPTSKQPTTRGEDDEEEQNVRVAPVDSFDGAARHPASVGAAEIEEIETRYIHLAAPSFVAHRMREMDSADIHPAALGALYEEVDPVEVQGDVRRIHPAWEGFEGLQRQKSRL